MHCLNPQTLSECISIIILDDNENFSIVEVPKVLIGVGTFTSTSSCDEFAKLSAFCAHVPMFLCALNAYEPYVSMFQCALNYYMPACPHF